MRKALFFWSLLLAAPVQSEIIGSPIIVVPKTDFVLTATVEPSVDADKYYLSWTRGTSVIASDTVFDFPTDGIFSRNFTGVSNGDLLCLGVSAANTGGITAVDRMCDAVSVPPLPAIPSQPLVLDVVAE